MKHRNKVFYHNLKCFLLHFLPTKESRHKWSALSAMEANLINLCFLSCLQVTIIKVQFIIGVEQRKNKPNAAACHSQSALFIFHCDVAHSLCLLLSFLLQLNYVCVCALHKVRWLPTCTRTQSTSWYLFIFLFQFHASEPLQ